MTMPDNSRLKRDIQPMPDDVRQVLLQRSLMAEYDARPDYQRNDYLMWIAGAKREATRQKRIDQMLDELARGGVYMNMKSTSRRP
ncbi:MAG TPA: YdeI/OmpD-associated family protein [Dehalococcoidia bacterium]|nr:YdeI/OmpD-associated family protein [Dehalococcoidia bacterium]